MPSEDGTVEIVICLGSSCYARGNSGNLAILKKFAETHAVHLAGCLCQDQCKQSPNVTIDGVAHHGVNAEALRELLQEVTRQHRGNHGAA